MTASGLSAVMLVSGGVQAQNPGTATGLAQLDSKARNLYSILPIRRTALTSRAVSMRKNASKAAPSR